MEPVTHLLTGACLARCGFNRRTALATVTMALAAEAPDLDMLAYLKNSVVGFGQHRGATHTVWGIPLVALLVVAVVFAGYRLWRRFAVAPGPHRAPTRWGEGAPAEQPHWGRLFLYACVAGYSHLLLDFTNSYGIRPLWPWWPKWYAWDIVFIVEPVLLAALIGGLTLPALFALINQEIGARSRGPRGRLGAAVALALVALTWGVRDYEHRRAVNAIEALTYQGRTPLRVSALPYMLNPFVWYGLVDTGESYVAMNVDSLAPSVDPQGRARVYRKPEPTPALHAAEKTELGRVYLQWSRTPLVETEKLTNPQPSTPANRSSLATPAGYLVRFRDLRFMYPDSPRTALSAYVLLSPALEVEESGFARSDRLRTGFASGSPFGGERKNGEPTLPIPGR